MTSAARLVAVLALVCAWSARAAAQPNCPTTGSVISCTPVTCSGPATPLGCHNASRQYGRMIQQPLGCQDRRMTRERCFEFCNGTRYAALEGGNQCWCGDSLTTSTPAGSWCATQNDAVEPACSRVDCQEHQNHTGTVPCCCTGNTSESCGGFEVIELYDIENIRCKPRRSANPFCNESQPIDVRVADLISRATWQEKLSMLNHKNDGISRLTVPKFQYSECLHGVETKCGEPSGENSTGCATSFPCALGTAASFNASLFRLIGQAVGKEARAFFNQGKTGLSYWAPDVRQQPHSPDQIAPLLFLLVRTKVLADLQCCQRTSSIYSVRQCGDVDKKVGTLFVVISMARWTPV
jgi:hypothetical protein